jgi:hypothetical protein
VSLRERCAPLDCGSQQRVLALSGGSRLG